MGPLSNSTAKIRQSNFYAVKSHRSKLYLDFIRNQPCIVSGSDYGVVAHHVRILGNGGTGLKPSDFLTVPLTHEHHMALHSGGERSFYKKHNIDINNSIKCFLLSFLESFPTNSDVIESLDYISL